MLRSRPHTCWVSVLTCAAALLGPGMSWAGILPADGAKKLEEQWSTREAREFYPALQRGQQQVTKEAEPYIDLAAKWFTYRLTWPENQKTPGKMDDLVKTLRKELQSSALSRP